MNRDIEAHLPQGDAALDWHRVINEAQMVLHEHAVNETREARGAATVNSIWLWAAARCRQPDVRSTLLRGATMPSLGRSPPPLASHGVTCPATAQRGLPRQPQRTTTICWCSISCPDALRGGGIAAWREQLAMLERHWIASLASALRAREISAITLVATNSDNLLEATVTPALLWRLWRRARPLASYAGP